MTLATLLALTLSQTPLPEAAELLDRREETLGPLATRLGARGLVITGAMTLPDGSEGATFEELHRVAPGEEQVRFSLTMGAWGTTSQGTDGTASWTTDPAFGVAVQAGPEQMPVRRVWAIQRSAPWRTLYRAARTLGVVERDGRKLVELELTPPEGKSERWYVDPTTLELARVAVVYPNPTGGILPMEWTLGDWKPVDGILYPHRRGQVLQMGPAGADGAPPPTTTFRYVCRSIRHETLDAARLAPSPEVAAALADPARRAPAPPEDASACSLETTTKIHTATIRVTCAADKVSATLASILPEVGAAIRTQGARMASPPFTRYHRIDTEARTIDLEAGIAVHEPMHDAGRVKAGALPAGKAAMTWHVGSYHELQKSYDRLEAWMKARELAPAGGFWEIYWTDPGLEPDPSTWRTQIFWPVE